MTFFQILRNLLRTFSNFSIYYKFNKGNFLLMIFTSIVLNLSLIYILKN